MGPISCPEKSVRNYHYSLRNTSNPQKCASQNAARSFLYNFGKRQTFINYKVWNYFYLELFEILVLPSFSIHSLPIAVALWSEAWYVCCRSIIGSCCDFRWDTDVRVSPFLVSICSVHVQILQRSSHSHKESHQAWTNKIRNPETRWPWSTPTSSAT